MPEPRPIPNGTRFTRLVVIAPAGSDAHGRVYLCRCDCGAERVIRRDSLTSGNTRSCGCLQRERSAEVGARVNLKHGHDRGRRRTPEYRAWLNIIGRCYNPAVHNFARYGGRGIAMAPEWRESFAAFFAYVGPRPSPQHSVDRYPDPNGNYEPGNVRWATKTEQARNTRRNRLLTLNGETLCMAEWAERVGIAPLTLQRRLNLGWPVEAAILTPPYGKRESHVQ